MLQRARQASRFQWAAALLIAAASGAGCGGAVTSDGGVEAALDGGVDGAPGDAAPGDAAPGDGAPGDSRAAFCMGTGPAVVVGDGTESRCAGTLAEHTFLYGVCVCHDADVRAGLTTDGFDSSTGGYTPGGAGGAVGVDGNLSTTGGLDVGWTLDVAGASALDVSSAQTVRWDMRTAGMLRAEAGVEVGRDAWIHGGVDSRSSVHVARDLYMPPGATASGAVTVDGATHSTAFTVAPPCDCAPGDLVDVGAIARDGAAHNDNAAIGLDPSSLADVRTGTEVTVPCGRFYLDSIHASAGLTIHVPGRTALFIGGDVQAGADLAIDVGATGELDVFVGGDLTLGGGASFGNPSRPAAARFYVAGSHAIELGAGLSLYGNLYAPNAALSTGAGAEVYGSVFVGSLTNGSGFAVHYDRAVLHAGDACPMTPPPGDAGAPGHCQSCGDCRASQGCADGVCGPCRSDADCCAPLTCDTARGTCVATPG